MPQKHLQLPYDIGSKDPTVKHTRGMGSAGRQTESIVGSDLDMEANHTGYDILHPSAAVQKHAVSQDGSFEDDGHPRSLHRARRPFLSPEWRFRLRQAWSNNRVQLTFAFLAGMILASAVFSLSLPSVRSAKAWKSMGRKPHCERINGALLPFGYSPLALQNMTGKDLAVPDRLIVAARHHEDTSWLDTYLSEIPHVVYQIDEPNNTVGAQHATIANKGNEAMAYLQFIIDYFEKLPPSMVFLHGHRSAWHLLDVVPVLQQLKWDSHGFAPLRYKNSPGSRLDWKCGTRTDDPIWKQFDCDWEGAHLRPGNFSLRNAEDVNEVNKDLWVDSLEMFQIFEDELGPVPQQMRAPCCSTFLVSRERILAHNKEFYVHLRDWIIRTEMNSYRTGRMLEYTWHIIFGEEPVMPAVTECSLLRCDKT